MSKVDDGNERQVLKEVKIVSERKMSKLGEEFFVDGGGK